MGGRIRLVAIVVVFAAGSFPAQAAQRGVSERDCGFVQPLIFIHSGDSVTWTYAEDASTACAGQDHRVLSRPGDPQAFDSSPGCNGAFSTRHTCMGDPPKRKTFTVTLTQPGTYLYYCPFHATIAPDGTCSGMCGEIVINPPLTQPPPSSPSPAASKPKPTASATSPSPSASASTSPSPSPSSSVLAAGRNGAGGAGRGIIAVAVIAVLVALGALVWRVFIVQR